MPHVITLCLHLLETVEIRKVKLCKQYERQMPIGVGEYVLNIDDPGGPLFKPAIAVIETG
jgi:hypothetical protein